MSPASRPRIGRGDAIAVLRRNPAFARVYAAQLVSFAGDWFAVVALQGLILDLTGSPALAGAMLAAQILPTALVAPLAGVIVDRLDRKAVMVVADVARGLLALGLLLARSEDTLWIAFVCQGTASALAAFFDPASSAALPNLVDPKDLPTANVLMGSTWGTMLAVGAALGGVVAATFGREAAIVGDAVSFGVSALLLATVRRPFQDARPARAERTTVAADVLELLRFAAADRRVAALLIVKGGFGLAGGVIALISVMATQVFERGDTGIGILMSARGAGALIGPFLFRRAFGTDDRSLFRAILVAFGVFGAGYALLAAAPGLWLAALGAFVAHVGGGAQWTMSSIGLQRFSPDRIRGRVFAADYMLVSLTIGISMGVAGVIASTAGPRPVLVGMSALALLWGAGWLALTRRAWPAPRSTPDAAAARLDA